MNGLLIALIAACKAGTPADSAPPGKPSAPAGAASMLWPHCGQKRAPARTAAPHARHLREISGSIRGVNREP